MMCVPVEIKSSPVHGYGIFARQEIPKGTVIWSYSRIFDHQIAQHVLVRATKEEQAKLLARGFRNPHAEDTVVMCGDEAQFMNFSPLETEANVIVSGAIDGFDILVAARNIGLDEELLVEAKSDLDYLVKIRNYASGAAKED